MGHIHDVFNTDERFVIDPDRQQITQMSGKNRLTKGDHKSECFAFEMPRYVDGHDMSVCNSVRIHYSNAASNKSGEAVGPYIVTDLAVDSEDDEKVIFSWSPSRNATKYAGTLGFSIEFRCLTGTVVDYQRTVGTFSGLGISDRIENSGDEIVEEYVDVLEGWREELFGSGEDDDTDDSGVEIKSVVGVIDSHYYNFRFLNEDRGASMDEIRAAALSEDKDIIIRLDLDNWQGTLRYLGLVNVTTDGSEYKEALLFTTVKTNNAVINTDDNTISGAMQMEYWYTLLDPGEDMPPVAFVNCQFAEINLVPGVSKAGSFMRVNDDGFWGVEKVNIIQAPMTASVGQYLVVKAVDENGKPTEWETANYTGDPILSDTVTGMKYIIQVVNGALTMTEVTE